MPNRPENDRSMFADELKAMRAKRGWTLDEVAARIHFGRTTVVNMESGNRAPTPQQAKILDEVFETSGTFARIERRIRGIPFSAGFRPFSPHEAAARSIRTYEHSLVPGLFQTREYAQAISEVHPGADEDSVKEQVDARMERQVILTRDDPPLIIALLSERVLHEDIAEPAVMAVQMERLAKLARMPRIIIQIIPSQAHSGLRGAFVLAETPEPPVIVYLETAMGGQVVESPEAAEEMTLLFETLRAKALTSSASLAKIEEWAQRWREQISP